MGVDGRVAIELVAERETLDVLGELEGIAADAGFLEARCAATLAVRAPAVSLCFAPDVATSGFCLHLTRGGFDEEAVGESRGEEGEGYGGLPD